MPYRLNFMNPPGASQVSCLMSKEALAALAEAELLKEFEALLAHEIAGALHVETLSNHGAVCTVCSSEGIVAVDVRKFPAPWANLLGVRFPRQGLCISQLPGPSCVEMMMKETHVCGI